MDGPTDRDFTILGVDFDWLYSFVEPLWLLWLVGLFTILVIWVYWPSRKKQLEQYSRIPLEDDPEQDSGKER